MIRVSVQDTVTVIVTDKSMQDFVSRMGLAFPANARMDARVKNLFEKGSSDDGAELQLQGTY